MVRKKTRKDKNDSYFPLLTLSLYLTIEFHTLLTYQRLRLSLRVDLANSRTDLHRAVYVYRMFIRHCTYFFFCHVVKPMYEKHSFR